MQDLVYCRKRIEDCLDDYNNSKNKTEFKKSRRVIGIVPVKKIGDQTITIFLTTCNEKGEFSAKTAVVRKELCDCIPVDESIH